MATTTEPSDPEKEDFYRAPEDKVRPGDIVELFVPTLRIHGMCTWSGASRTWLVTGASPEHWGSRRGMTDPIPEGATYRPASDVTDEEKEAALAAGGAMVTTWATWSPA